MKLIRHLKKHYFKTRRKGNMNNTQKYGKQDDYGQFTNTQKGFNNTQSSFGTNPASLKGKLMSLEVKHFISPFIVHQMISFIIKKLFKRK